MRRFLLLFLLLLLSRSLLCGENEEFRATWVVTWEWARSDGDIAAQKARIREILDNHQRAHMNAVIWQVRQSGTAYYPSSYEPWGYYLGHRNPGFDPIAYAVKEAHARGLEFHAWMNTFEARSSIKGTPVDRHPEWICRDGSGNPMPKKYSLSPGLEEVRAYLVAVAMEIVRKYDIDGLHLDYVRWNEYTTSTIGTMLAKFADPHKHLDGWIPESQVIALQNTSSSNRYLFDYRHPYSAGIPAGFSSWEEWWRWSVTEFVHTLHDSIKAVKPWVRLSPAALGKYNWGGWNGYNVVYQDAALWFNKGYIDQLIGMHYHWTTAAGFASMLATGCPDCWKIYIQDGLQAGRLFTVGPGSFILNDQNKWSNHEQIVETCRKYPWVDGFQFFSYGDWEERKYWRAVAESFFSRKTRIRAAVLIDSLPPDPPAINLTKIDSLHYQITILPAPSDSSAHWFALYRSENPDPDPATDEIVAIRFQDSTFTVAEQFSGLQDYNGTYVYFATSLDRFWNESLPSSGIESEPIPSFPPTVIDTTPGEGDTVAVNTPLQIIFSKRILPSSFLPAFTISPPVEIAQVVGSNRDRIITVTFNGNLAFATEYTVTLSPELTDVNGKALDGNGDGIPGDSFSFHFMTKARDVDGPQILASHPTRAPFSSNFDVQDLLTVTFDEWVDRNSITDTSITLTRGEERIESAYLLVNVGERSILNVQPLLPLDSDTEYNFHLSAAISDTAGNPMGTEFVVSFRTAPYQYSEIKIMEPFLSTSNWASPGYSGSTTGIYAPHTTFKMSGTAYLPNMPIRQHSSAALAYEWDESKSKFLIREYLLQGAPREILFDTSYVLQCYVFGDGSMNRFRFAVDDSSKDRAEFHEVSKWTTLDWYGWRLVEWQLNDPASVGQWIGDGRLDGPSLRFDSFQLTHEIGNRVRGVIYLDNLRLVKKVSIPVSVAGLTPTPPSRFALFQNYPNPFNPVTTLCFQLPKASRVRLTIFDLLGREIMTLVDQPLPAGVHRIRFDASHLSSGIYIYRLTAGKRVATKRMTLLK